MLDSHARVQPQRVCKSQKSAASKGKVFIHALQLARAWLASCRARLALFYDYFWAVFFVFVPSLYDIVEIEKLYLSLPWGGSCHRISQKRSSDDRFICTNCTLVFRCFYVHHCRPWYGNGASAARSALEETWHKQKIGFSYVQQIWKGITDKGAVKRFFFCISNFF